MTSQGRHPPIKPSIDDHEAWNRWADGKIAAALTVARKAVLELPADENLEIMQVQESWKTYVASGR